MILVFLIQSIIAFFVFIIMLSASHLPGGQVGMTPFLLLFVLGAQFIIGSIIYGIFRHKLINSKKLSKNDSTLFLWQINAPLQQMFGLTSHSFWNFYGLCQSMKMFFQLSTFWAKL